MSEEKTNPFPGLRPFKFHEHELFFGREEQYEQMVKKLGSTRFLAVVGTSGSGKSSLVRAGLIPALYHGMMTNPRPKWRAAIFRPKEDPIRELSMALNHRRVFGASQTGNGSSRFRVGEVIDWPSLCARLNDETEKARTGPTSRVIGRLPLNLKQVILGGASKRDLEQLPRSEFVHAFNAILQQRDFYHATEFERVAVTHETRELLKRGQHNLSDTEIEKLNRLLLEASYPQEIAKNAAIQTKITEVTLRLGDLGLVEAVRQANLGSDENLLVVVDQFEELFRYAKISENGPHGNQAAAFVKLLLEASNQRDIPIYIVLTMRSDYLGDCAKFWDLPEAINEGQYLIPRLTRDQFREAIRGPITSRGVEIAPQLVNRLLRDMGDDPDQLPILQHALMRTWEKWNDDHVEGQRIDVRHYDAVGKMAEALCLHADEAYNDLPDDRSRWIAEKLFKCLTEKGSGERETRRPTQLRELRAISKAEYKELISVINVFRQKGRSFLMPSAGKTLTRKSSIDISHESLIRNWKRLRQWVDDEAQAASNYRRLAETAKLHDEGKAPLLSDVEVKHALGWRNQNNRNRAWAARYHPYFNDTIQKTYKHAKSEKSRRLRDRIIFDRAIAFLDTSRLACLRKKEELKKRRRLQLRRTQAIAAVFILAFVFCLVFWQTARTEKELSKLLIYAGNINSARSEFDRGDFARMYRLLGTLSAPAYDHMRGFEWHFSTRPDKSLQYRLTQPDSVLSVAYLPDRHQLASACADGTVTLWDAKTGSEINHFKLAERAAKVVFSPDGKSVATVDSTQKEATLWDMTDGRRIGDLKEFDPAEGTSGEHTHSQDNKTNVQAVAVAPDGKFVVVSLASRDEQNPESSKNTIQIWDASTLRLTNQTSETSSHAFLTLAVSIDGTVAIGSSEGTIDLLAAQSLQRLGRFQETFRNTIDMLGPDSGTNSITTLAFSPDGKMLASGRTDGSINLWSVAAQKEVKTISAHPRPITSIAFSEDGKTLASAGDNGSVGIWETGCLSALSTKNESKDCREQAVLTGHSDSILSVSFRSDSNLLATASRDKTVGLWDTNAKSDARSTSFPGYLDQTSFIKFSPDGKVLGAVSRKGLVKVWDATTMEEKSLRGSDGRPRIDRFASLVFAPGGKVFATWNPEGGITLWDTNTLTETGKLQGATPTPRENKFLMAFSKKSDRLITWTQEEGITVYDTKLKLAKVSTRPLLTTSNFLLVAFSPDLGILAAGISNGGVELWDTRTGRLLTELRGNSGPVLSIAFSNDGRRLATGYADNTVKIWDPTNFEKPVTLTGHSAPVQALAFSDDGKRLATGSWDASVKIWDTDPNHWDMNVDLWNRTKNRQELLTLQEKGQEDPILSVSFSPDGKTLAAARANNSIRLW
ncbi:MAG TPA: hypothetical protein VEW46_16950 [Pyrinomonadaceae bacterium]|nr:hypothetical protein [Pyrinomonadaceae bacterium]